MTYWNTIKIEIETRKAEILLISEKEMSFKPSSTQWSKREILGHLIDSAKCNLKRFSEIRNSIYFIKPYSQKELVIENDYQNEHTSNLLFIWLKINTQIVAIIKEKTAFELDTNIVLISGERKNLGFLINDYILHLKHHLNQIIES